MCVSCWITHGQPANRSPEIDRAADLVRALYDIHPVGGPLHVVVDDWNLEDEFLIPYYVGYPGEELDTLHDGRSMRQICDELSALLLSMSMEDRMSVLAHHGGYATAVGPMSKGTETR